MNKVFEEILVILVIISGCAVSLFTITFSVSAYNLVCDNGYQADTAYAEVYEQQTNEESIETEKNEIPTIDTDSEIDRERQDLFDKFLNNEIPIRLEQGYDDYFNLYYKDANFNGYYDVEYFDADNDGEDELCIVSDYYKDGSNTIILILDVENNSLVAEVSTYTGKAGGPSLCYFDDAAWICYETGIEAGFGCESLGFTKLNGYNNEVEYFSMSATCSKSDTYSYDSGSEFTYYEGNSSKKLTMKEYEELKAKYLYTSPF